MSDKPRLISQFFRQNFSQPPVTNPPIDSLRERHVMSLKTRFSTSPNILDTGRAQDGVLVLGKPCPRRRGLGAFQGAFRRRGAGGIDCTFAAGGGLPTRYAPRSAHPQPGRTGRARAKSRNCSCRIATSLTTRSASPACWRRRRSASHLVRRGLRSYCSINVETAECINALLCGADRGRRDDGLCVSGGSGDRRPAWSRPFRRDEPRQVPRQPSQEPWTKACSRSCRRWGSR
ncbi:glutamate synthase central domain-containing protein [Sphingomonas panacisoli]|uniref:glutamate synthase central domain-containing protein n=1 Tax=Sphingomonas panacisoli TaxID=1813879 RepID=UPI001EFF674A|nr:glutamate synthase central domain-containing protein [Sphingomonas panacisoli]